MVNSAFFFYKIKVPIVLNGIYPHLFPKETLSVYLRYNVNDLIMIWYQQITVLPLHFFQYELIIYVSLCNKVNQA